MSESETVWSFTTPEDGNAFPEDFVRMIWSYGQTAHGRISRRPSSEEVLGTLVNTAFSASLQTEEGRPVRFQLLFHPHEREITTAFEEPLAYSSHNLVKLAPTVDIGFRYIVVAPEQPGSDTLAIVGLSDLELSQLANKPMRRVGGGLDAHSPDTQSMKLAVFGPGLVRVELSMSTFELRNCSIRFPFSIEGIKYIREWYDEASQCLDFSELPVDPVVGEVEGWNHRRRGNAQALVRRTWASIVGKVCQARHGGTFLVIPKDAAIEEHLRVKYFLRSNQLQNSIQKRATYEPGLSNPNYRWGMEASDLDDAHFSERDLSRAADLVASFASVDGAVVLERDLTLVGFGAEILDTKFPDDDEKVKYGRHPHGRPKPRRLSDFGMRHRTAFRFCEKIEGALAFVLSQDGGIRVFCNTGGETVIAFEGPTFEDWIFPSATVAAKSDDESPS